MVVCEMDGASLKLVGIKNLVLEVDTKSIKDMLNNPDLQPNAVEEINKAEAEEEADDWLEKIALYMEGRDDEETMPDMFAVKENNQDTTLCQIQHFLDILEVPREISPQIR
ncbi:hypothetical protein NEOLEDRAFT_1148536 [Neolentinus lepideus HHB14362 ss-1]|uniref:Reverse transcriptase RNase H-like domain-containing protein n=1 Tax=Neolentinus lepideus HHB14362 ss-1 TaxID=1314782 RepID=A0A165S6E6_9AGAM|nr:hypothetical protein NEOLEDRAFT_1148536 [Neolentinus lepideus HHB14362 ss-1]